MPYTNAAEYSRGELNEKSRVTLERNMNTLRYLEGAGMTTRTKLKIRDDTVYLMVGLGGQGIRKLTAVKHQLERDCSADDISRCVRFLAVDTAIVELRQNPNFGPTETVEIKTGTAAVLADPDSKQFLPWVHPRLSEHITGQTGSLGWSGDGANQCRQAGRVKLADSQNRQDLISKARSAILSMNPNKTKKVRVIIIAGLAGGTGSGTIVDVPYIIREKVNGGNLVMKAEDFIIEGYVLLPPACGNETDLKKAAGGNRNAYAALKEIEYLMMLSSQHKANPQAEYRFCDIHSTRNIFETCTVVDGMYAGGGAVAEPAKLANEIVAHTIVTSMADLIARDSRGNELNKDQDTFFGSASYIANLAQECANQLANTDYQQCPREANYRFISCGYSEVIVPVDLMTVYVANKVFRRIWTDYCQAFVIQKNEAEAFIREQNLTVRDIKNRLKRREEFPFRELPQETRERMNNLFKSFGPYYMVNLLRAVVDFLSDAYINQGPRNAAYDEAREYLRSYRGILRQLQHEDYSVYTLVIEQLQQILENDAQILTDTRRHKETFRETFYWEPIDLTKGDAGQKAVKDYLDNLMSEVQIEDMANQFRDELVKNRDIWVDMFNKNTFDAASRIRSFIEDKIGSIVKATVEDYLVKLFTENPNASVMGNDNDNSPQPEIENALNRASARIFEHFDTHSAPLANMDETDIHVFGNGLRNYILPTSTPRIAEKLKTNHNIDSNNVYFGSAADRLICMTMYVGVPAFFYRWTEDGEKAYEQDSAAIGLHMDQKGGKVSGGWTDLPNLIPVSKKVPAPREAALLADAKALLDEGLKYKLVYKDPNPQEYEYNILALVQPAGITDQMSPDEISQLRVETARERIQTYIDQAKHPFTVGAVVANPIPNMATAHELVDDLERQVQVLVPQRLSIGTQTLRPGVNLNEAELEQYKYELAVKLLRKSLFSQQSLGESVELMRFFENYVSQRNEQFAYEWRLADRLDYFRKLLLSGVVTHDEDEWRYTVDNAPRSLIMYANEQRAAKKFNLYLAYLHFVSLKDSVYEQLKNYYEHVLAADRKRGRYLESERARYYEEVLAIAHEADYTEEFAMQNESFSQKLSESGWRDPNGNPVTAEQLRTFYQDMERNLKPATATKAVAPTAPAVQTEDWSCPSCGRQDIGKDFKFCPECGAKKPENKPQSGGQTCPSCGKQGIAAEAKFCPECGTRLQIGGQTCPSCGKQGIAAEVKFCPECGTRLQIGWTCPSCGKQGIAANVNFCPECGTKQP